MNSKELNNLTDEQKKVLAKLSPRKMILPIIIGLGVVSYLLWTQYDPVAFASIQWTHETFRWIGAAFLLLILRHLAFSMRMYILSRGHFSFKKCIELIFIFEFSLCVTPTTLGGSAVSLFVMTQEKLSAARTTAIVLYKVVLDTMFFIGTIPILFIFCGASMIRPNMVSIWDVDWKARLFYISYAAMASYGSFLFYGLFINPRLIKRFLFWVTGFSLLKRFHEKANKLGDEIIIASSEMKNMSWGSHAAAFVCTWTAWTCKFFLISCLIYGIAHPLLGVERERPYFMPACNQCL
jgi:glycosyltransferase 2 family protein